MERSHRTHNEEFCEVMAASDQLPTLNRQLLGWEHTCNCVRPPQVLGYLTRLVREPMETIRPKSKVSLIYWTSTPLLL